MSPRRYDDTAASSGPTRRSVLKTGLVLLTGAGAAGLDCCFIAEPDTGPNAPLLRNVPLQKPPRTTREAVPGFLWLDAADLEHYGGWALDTQFIQFMGSSYLLAHGAGQPVADARSQLRVTTPGRYRVWLRSRNWETHTSPGRFDLRVGQQRLGPFGTAANDAWCWQDGGVVELRAEPVTLRLRDRTGYYGRCSSILFARDLDYQPPTDLTQFAAERRRLLGQSAQPTFAGRFDIVVVGGGSAGCCAALAAARLGAKTALINDRPVLGGNASIELGVPVQGAAAHHPEEYLRESGLVEEAGRLAMAQRWGTTMSWAFDSLVQAQANLWVFSNNRLLAAERSGPAIRRLTLIDTLTLDTRNVEAPMYIDATGDGWLGYHAQAEYRIGREAGQAHGEPLAPAVGDARTMSGCLRGPVAGYQNCAFYQVRQRSGPVHFEAPPWAAKLDEETLAVPRRGRNLQGSWQRGSWWLEHRNDVDDLFDGERARDELLRINFGFWDFVKNRWAKRAQTQRYELSYVPFTNAKRESRRLMGDYILTQQDCQQGRRFADAIGHYGWRLDLHALDGIFDQHGPYYCDVAIPAGTIPYRSLYSRNVTNLMMAGRCISVTHLALGTVRVQGQCSVTGQAAGTAAALALAHGVTPRAVAHKHTVQLQQLLLRQDQFIPGVFNHDEGDLARDARITASSVHQEVALQDLAQHAELGTLYPLATPQGVVFPWHTDVPLRGLRLLLQADINTELRVHLAGLQQLRPPAGLPSHRVPVSLGAGPQRWVAVPLERPLRAPFVLCAVDANPAARWRLLRRDLRRSTRLAQDPAHGWRQTGHEIFAFLTSPDAPLDAAPDHRATNVVNGVARPTPSRSNMWQSADGLALPQWLELSWAAPIRCSEVCLVFDTDLNPPLPHSAQRPPMCVRDYHIDIETEQGWQPVAKVTGNYQRRRLHRFAARPTRRLRVVVDATNGSPTARILEVRVYHGIAKLL